MRWIAAIATLFCAQSAYACDAPVCSVNPDELALTRIITFEDTRSSHGPGHRVEGILVISGAQFGEHFAGQSLMRQGDHDQVLGAALNPLTLLSGDKASGLSVVFMGGNNVLNGYGAAGFPRREAQGEGAMAWLFDEDQSALAFELRGGEGGQAQVIFLRRDGTEIATLALNQIAEYELGFQRGSGAADIAGVVVTNTDPQGIALDNLRFGRPPDMS